MPSSSGPHQSCLLGHDWGNYHGHWPGSCSFVSRPLPSLPPPPPPPPPPRSRYAIGALLPPPSVFGLHQSCWLGRAGGAHHLCRLGLCGLGDGWKGRGGGTGVGEEGGAIGGEGPRSEGAPGSSTGRLHDELNILTPIWNSVSRHRSCHLSHMISTGIL